MGSRRSHGARLVTIGGPTAAVVAAVVVACGPKPTEPPRGAPPPAREAPEAARPAPPPARPAAVKARPEPRALVVAIGIPVCDAYLKMYRCYLGKLPKEAAVQARAAYVNMVETWRKTLAAAGPDIHPAVAKGCQTALDAWRKAMEHNPMSKGCLPP